MENTIFKSVYILYDWVILLYRRNWYKIVNQLTLIKKIFFLLFRAVPAAHGGSQARGQIRATAANLHHSYSNTVSEPPLRTTPQLIAMPDP